MDQRIASPNIIFSGMLEINKNRRQHLQTKEESSQFLSLASLEGIWSRLGSQGEPWIVTIEIDDFFSLVAKHGDEVGFQLLNKTLATAHECLALSFPGSRLLSSQRAGIGEYALFLELAAGDAPEVMAHYEDYQRRLSDLLVPFSAELLGQEVVLRVGLAHIVAEQSPGGLERAALRSYCEAQRLARCRPDASRARLHRDFVEILRDQNLNVLFQPVLDLRCGQILGWEALSRGPEGSPLHEPRALFAYAEEIGELFRLERLSRERALDSLRGLGMLPNAQKLFLNSHVAALNDPCFGPATFKELLAARQLLPQSLVLEFSERQGTMDLNLLLRKLEAYRREGFLVAMDDVGAGNSSLRSLSLIRPDYIKADISLVAGIGSNPFKRVMIETLVLLAEKIGSLVIAEGVESESEYTTLASMGVHAGQGYLFARPMAEKPEELPCLPAKATTTPAAKNDWKCSTPVVSLVERTMDVAPDASVASVKQLLSGAKPLSSVVVVDQSRPVGLVMSYHLDRHLGTQYGVALFYRRSVSLLMDTAPLIVDCSQAVEDVARLAMNRENQKIYDDIVVVQGGRFMGTVSVQKILDTLAQVQVELAKGSNPLSGLPGNVSIELEITRRAKEKRASSFIYVDLDNFKVFNDLYGFNNGDKAILLIAKVIKDALRKVGGQDDFIGHVGGDDFIIIAGQERCEDICRCVAEAFGQTAPALYNVRDRERGHVVARGRDGKMGKFPLLSVSMGIVDCQFASPFSMEEMSQRVAEIKRYAKSRPGNSYVRDRRSPLGALETMPPPELTPKRAQD